METESETNKRLDKIIQWLKDPYNLGLVSIVLFALIVRVYFYIQTPGQALWWDESEYLSTAKKWAFGVPYILNPQRPPLFQAFAALIYLLGFGENIIKLLLVIIPSVALVLFIYYLGNEMYNKTVGLIAAFLASVSWTLVFWTSRVQPDYLSMGFQVLSIWAMWKYWKEEKIFNKKEYLPILSGIFAAVGFYFKVSALLVPIIFMVFIFVKDRLSGFKNKDYYYFAAAFLLTLIPYFIWAFLTFGTPTAFTSGYVTPVPAGTPYGWYNIQFYSRLTTQGLPFTSSDGNSILGYLAANPIQGVLSSIILILFLIGVGYALRVLLYGDLLIKEKKRCFDPDIFGLVSLLTISAFYIFHIKNTDDRWVFLWLPFIFYFAGNSVSLIYEKMKRYNQFITIGISVVILLIAGYYQLSAANTLVNGKIDSYKQVQLGGEWINQHSSKNDGVFSVSYTQMTYYTEREVTAYGDVKDSQELLKLIDEKKPRYFVWSVFENVVLRPTFQWFYPWMDEKQKTGFMVPVQAYFADSSNTQPLLVVYEIHYDKENVMLNSTNIMSSQNSSINKQ